VADDREEDEQSGCRAQVEGETDAEAVEEAVERKRRCA
jgi:hypothetical protein